MVAMGEVKRRQQFGRQAVPRGREFEDVPEQSEPGIAPAASTARRATLE